MVELVAETLCPVSRENTFFASKMDAGSRKSHRNHSRWLSHRFCLFFLLFSYEAGKKSDPDQLYGVLDSLEGRLGAKQNEGMAKGKSQKLGSGCCRG